MKTTSATYTENRWIPIKTFSERVGIKLRTARYWVHSGKIKIKPKEKPKEHVYVDWYAWNADR